MARTEEMTLDEALRHGPPPPGNLAVPIFRHGSLEVEMYTPVGTDPQTAHQRDEVYVVARGAVIAFDTKAPSGIDYNVEIMIMWDSPGEETNVRVIAAVDDQHWPAWFSPMSDSFIVAPDGSFVGE